jgi:hypothetical protein
MLGIIILVLAVGGLGGCLGTKVGFDESRLNVAVDELAADAVRASQGREVTLLPLRDHSGEVTPETRLVDEMLVSALVRAKGQVRLAEDDGHKWPPEGSLPARYLQEEGKGPYILYGRMRREAGYDFLQTRLVRRQDAVVVTVGQRRLAAGAVERMAAQRVRRSGGTVVRPLEVEFHLVARHDEGQFAEQISLVEGAELEVGDRFQLRFRLSRDAQVYAFLYDSEGQSEEIVPGGTFYSGRIHYGPAVEGWVRPGESDRVYTLFFIATENLDEERDRMFEDMRRLIDEGRVDRFTGLELLDGVVAAYVEQRLQGEGQVKVLRGIEVPLGQAEKIIYNDGTVLESRHERLGARPALVRAISFSLY